MRTLPTEQLERLSQTARTGQGHLCDMADTQCQQDAAASGEEHRITVDYKKTPKAQLNTHGPSSPESETGGLSSKASVGQAICYLNAKAK